jgi:sugar lactone lactonase YvrE
VPSNPFQAGCTIAEYATTAINVGECLGTATTVIACALSATGVGGAICAATVDLTTSTLAPDCAEFILDQVVQHYSKSAAQQMGLIQLSIEPSDDPLDYAVAYCDLANSATSPSSGPVSARVAGNGQEGDHNGPVLSVTLNSPLGIALDASGNVYFADYGNNQVRVLTAASTVAAEEVTNFAGTGTAGYTGDNYQAIYATLNHPTQLAFDGNNLYIADAGNNVVREVSGGIITTVAGTGHAGYNGDSQEATQAELNFPDSIAFDKAGNLFIADAGNNRIREVSNGYISTVAGTGTGGYNMDNISATAAELNEPTRVSLDNQGNMYIADYLNNRVRVVNKSSGIITTLAGKGTAGYTGDNGPAQSAELDGPLSVFLDAEGNVYIADQVNQVIRVVNMQPTQATLLGVLVQPGDIQTVEGVINQGGSQSDLLFGSPLSVNLSFPTGLFIDQSGNLYFADADNNVIVRVTKGN